jgi:hypothetical protein
LRSAPPRRLPLEFPPACALENRHSGRIINLAGRRLSVTQNLKISLAAARIMLSKMPRRRAASRFALSKLATPQCGDTTFTAATISTVERFPMAGL